MIMNILVTNYDNSGEDVCILNTTLTAEEIETGLKIKNQTFEEVYSIEDNELQFYIYDPLFADEKFDNGVKKLLSN